MAKPQYRGKHPKLRAQLMRQFVDGQPCLQPFNDGTICGQPMYRSQPLHLGHAEGGGWIGLVHAVCNDRAAAQKANAQRTRACKKCKQQFKPGKPKQHLCEHCQPTPITSGRPW